MKQLVRCPLEFKYMECSRLGGLHAFGCSSFRLVTSPVFDKRSSGVYDSCGSCRTISQFHFLAECFIVLHAKLLQLCPTLCSPMDCSLPGSSVHRIFQARILECITMPSSRGFYQSRDQTHVFSASCFSRLVLYH